MSTDLKNPAARAALLVLLFAVATPPLARAAPGGLSGTVVGPDGRPAPGYRVLALDRAGAPVASALTGAEGGYDLAGLAPGVYGMGLETPGGDAAFVDAPPVRVASGAGSRRDLKLRAVAPSALLEKVEASNYGPGHWWSQLGTAAKVWTIVGGLVVLGVTAAAIDGDDEVPASPI